MHSIKKPCFDVFQFWSSEDFPQIPHTQTAPLCEAVFLRFDARSVVASSRDVSGTLASW